ALAVDKVWRQRMAKVAPANTRLWKIGGILFTFHLVCFCWIFFHAASFADAWALIRQVAYDFQGNLLPEVLTAYPQVFILMGTGYLLHFLPAATEQKLEFRLARLPLWGSVAVMTAFIWFLAQVKTTVPMIPIYFQF